MHQAQSLNACAALADRKGRPALAGLAIRVEASALATEKFLFNTDRQSNPIVIHITRAQV